MDSNKIGNGGNGNESEHDVSERSGDVVDDGFSITRAQRRREMRCDKTDNPAVFGSTASAVLRAGARTREIFVFNLDIETDDDGLRSYFSDIGVEAIEIECRSNTNARNKSFRVVILHTDLKKVMDASNWPAGVGCRMYYKKREQNGRNEYNTQNNHNGSK